MKLYKNYRWFYTSRGSLVVGGKNAAQNDALLHEVLALKHPYYVFHTSHPGSPFGVLMRPMEQVHSEELLEAATFTGCFSRAWKERKRITMVDQFTTQHLSKEKNMKEGMWRVHGPITHHKVPLILALTAQHKTLRAVPIESTTKPFMVICPGTVDKLSMAAQLGVELGDTYTHDEIIAALPAGGVRKKS